MVIDMKINVAKVSRGYIAATTLGGISVRSQFISTPEEAVKNLFVKFTNSLEDTELALSLALDQSTLEEALAQSAALGSGEDS